MIVDQKIMWRGVKRLKDLKEEDLIDATVLITSDKPGIHDELLYELFLSVPREQCFELFPGSVEKQKEEINRQKEEINRRKDSVLNKLDITHLEDKGMCYNNATAPFILPLLHRLSCSHKE